MVHTARIWTWLPSENEDFVHLVGNIIASLPGAPPELEEMGYRPVPMGWTEVELLAELLSSIQNEDDVEKAAELFLHGEAGQEDDDEWADEDYEVTVKPNIEKGFYDRMGRFHPIRSSHDYDPEEVGEPEHWTYGEPPRTRRGRSPLVAKRRKKRKK